MHLRHWIGTTRTLTKTWCLAQIPLNIKHGTRQMTCIRRLKKCYPHSQKSYGARTASTNHLTASTRKALELNSRMKSVRANVTIVGIIGDRIMSGFVLMQKGEPMAEYVDLSERVTATYYDDEHEEWSQKTVTIADVLDFVCDDYTVLPSAQPEIIRCKDCNRHYAKSLLCKVWSKYGTVATLDTDYCSYAERKNDV